MSRRSSALGVVSLLLVLALVMRAPARADAGVLIPSNKPAPDPSILSLEEMEITVVIDNGVARVEVRQIFASHQGSILEGEYLFALPARATVSDFAVWDGVTRIPGVILERKRAGEIYENLKWQSIDPGLLQVGERGADEARRTAVFSAKIVPIPAYGTKRMEIEYHETIPVESLESYFAIPLRPDAYHAQVAGRLRIDFELRSAHAVRDFQLVGTTYPLQVKERTPNLVRGTFEGRNVTFTEDFAVRYAVDPAKTDRLEILTYREPVPGTPPPTVTAPEPRGNEPGFFEASAVLGTGSAAAADAPGKPRTVLALFDTSLSMQWEKLDRSYQALEALLRGLRPADRFNLVVFNTELTPWSAGFVAAEPAHVEAALAFVKSGYIRGGTNMERALGAALGELAGQRAGSAAEKTGTTACETNCYLVLFSDGGATRGSIQNARLAAGYEKKWRELPEAQRPRTFVFAVGDDANLPLLRLLARHDGVLEWARSTEPIEFKLQAFLSKIGRSPVAGLQLSAAPESNFDLTYPLDEAPYAGSVAAWIGQYRRPMPKAEFAVRGTRDGAPLEMRASAALPERNVDHPHLPRLWARRRVDALLEKIEREGEDRESIDEIVRLARKYKFVTPYTSFLAAPRALLRPRVIRPGDPVLRVKTDP
ncbi:MAG TPA: VIT and VWA domain-containing protein, partial [Terriglobales bacterium]|nr:VIT and VWA domain-containing protein [Terriglobales bacterium]